MLSGTGSGDASEEVPDVDRPGSAFSPVGVVLSMCPILCSWDTLSLSDRRSSLIKGSFFFCHLINMSLLWSMNSSPFVTTTKGTPGTFP